jgi:hypothetical protein
MEVVARSPTPVVARSSDRATGPTAVLLPRNGVARSGDRATTFVVLDLE